MEIKQTIINAHNNAKAKGFYDIGQDQNVAEKLMLIVSETTEALEAHRKDHFTKPAEHFGRQWDLVQGQQFKEMFEREVKNTFEDELADIVIRVFDLCGWLEIDLEFHIRQKMKYNAMREKLHGKKY